MCCQDRPLTMTVREVAALLNVSLRSVYRAVEAGVIPSIRIGRRILIPTALLYRACSASTTDTTMPTKTSGPGPRTPASPRTMRLRRPTLPRPQASCNAQRGRRRRRVVAGDMSCPPGSG